MHYLNFRGGMYRKPVNIVYFEFENMEISDKSKTKKKKKKRNKPVVMQTHRRALGPAGFRRAVVSSCRVFHRRTCGCELRAASQVSCCERQQHDCRSGCLEERATRCLMLNEDDFAHRFEL